MSHEFEVYTPITNDKIKIYDNVDVQYVLDGDTIDVLIDLGFHIFTKQRVRLFGIDTPESRTSDPEEKKYGLLAKMIVQSLCSCADTTYQLRCLEDNVDKYGRVVAELWSFHMKTHSWININKWLCDHYYAVPYIGQNKDRVRDHHLYNRTRLQHVIE